MTAGPPPSVAPISFYERLLGPRFHDLPAEIRRLRDVRGVCRAEGRCDIVRGRHPLARLLARRMNLPAEGRDVPIAAQFTAHGDREVWDRRFGPAPMHTVHALGRGAVAGLLVEGFGRLSFAFQVTPSAHGLHRELVKLRALGMWVRRPPGLAMNGWETVRDGRFHFSVTMDIPLIGRLIAYSGWLTPAD